MKNERVEDAATLFHAHSEYLYEARVANNGRTQKTRKMFYLHFLWLQNVPMASNSGKAR